MRTRVPALLLAVIAFVLAIAPAAAAHDELSSSIPANGYTVNALPATARLTFGEQTRAEDVTVTSGDRPLPVSAVADNPDEVSVDLHGVPATETVSLAWRAVDEHDGHVTSGVVAFHVLDHVPAAPVPSPAAVTGPLLATIPADGFTVTALPSTATFAFATKTVARDVSVTSAGKKLPVSDVMGKPNTVSIGLTGIRATEVVSLTWRAVRLGQKPASGVISFHVLDHVSDAVSNRSGQGGAAASGGPSHLHLLSMISRVAGYLSMAVLIGGLFFVSMLWPAGARDPRTRLLLGIATIVGGAAAVLGVYVATAQVQPLPFRDAIAQHFGRVSVSVALLWFVASVVVVALMQNPESVRRIGWRVSATVVSAGLIRAIGMSAHGTQGNHATLGLFIDFLHLAAVSAWVGGLTVMSVGLLPRRSLSELEDVVPKFSKVAAVSVALVILSGVLLAWELIGSLHGLWSTHYGHVLLVKLVFVGAVLAAATVSKRWVEQTLAMAVASDRRSAVSTFVASVGAETVLVIAVLGAASVLVTSSPGL